MPPPSQETQLSRGAGSMSALNPGIRNLFMEKKNRLETDPVLEKNDRLKRMGNQPLESTGMPGRDDF